MDKGVQTALRNRPSVDIKTELSALKVIGADGEEFDAKLVLHDEDLGVAFVAIDPKGDNAKDFKAKPIDISKDITVKHLDKLVSIGRMSEALRSQAQVTIGTVAAIVSKPRSLYLCQGLAMSTPVFTSTGDFVELNVAIKSYTGNLKMR